MSVQLILLEDVADLGKIGDEVHVANGYARNYMKSTWPMATPAIICFP